MPYVVARYYPVLPQGLSSSLLSAAEHIVDARIRVYCPPARRASDPRADTSPVYSAGVSISGSWGTLSIELPGFDVPPVESLTVPVFVLGGQDAPGPEDSYIMVDDLSAVGGKTFPLHPDCLDIVQVSPVVCVASRSGCAYTDGSRATPDDCSSGNIFDGCFSKAMPEVVLSQESLAFVDGYNVDVDTQNGLLEFSGAAGAGAGRWPQCPWSDGYFLDSAGSAVGEEVKVPDDAADRRPGRGMRSLNGMHGDVALTGGSPVSVQDALASDVVSLTNIRLGSEADRYTLTLLVEPDYTE